MSPILQADLIVLTHLAFMLFVLLGQLLVLLGGAFGWEWVRNRWFRIAHLACILYVAGQALLGIECPLTTRERALRGGDLYNFDGSLALARYASGVLFYDAPLHVFAWIYAGFALLVLLGWVLVPPRRRRPTHSSTSR